MEDPSFIHPWQMQMQSLGGDSVDEFDFESFSSENFSSYPSSCSPQSSTAYLSDSTIKNFQKGGMERPAKQLKTAIGKFSLNKGGKTPPEGSPSSSTCLISFGNSNPSPAGALTFYGNLACSGKPKDDAAACLGTMDFESLIYQEDYQNQEYSTRYGRGSKRVGSTRNPSQNQEHVIAERKRRVKLNQRFIALSAIVPGLKKVPYH